MVVRVLANVLALLQPQVARQPVAEPGFFGAMIDQQITITEKGMVTHRSDTGLTNIQMLLLPALVIKPDKVRAEAHRQLGCLRPNKAITRNIQSQLVGPEVPQQSKGRNKLTSLEGLENTTGPWMGLE